MASVVQVRGDDPRKAKAFIQLTHQDQAGVGGDARPLKRDLQKSVERELKGLGLSCTHWVSPSVACFFSGNP